MSINTENDYATYILVDGIIYITYKKDVILDLPGAVNVVKDRLNLHEGLFLPVLCDIRNLQGLNKAARSYLASEGSTLIRAVAVLVDSPVSKTLSKFFVQTSKPTTPTETFVDIEEALFFLQSFMDK